MTFRAKGRVNFEVIHSRPNIELYAYGQLIESQQVRVDGTYETTFYFVPSAPKDWVDVYLVVSTIGSPEKEPRDLRVLRLDEVIWEPLHAP